MSDLKPPFADAISGTLVRLGEKTETLLLMGNYRRKTTGTKLYRGPMILMYGFPLAYEQDFLLPQMVIDDFKRVFEADAALEFLLNKGNSYPRADVVGTSLSTMTRCDLFVKEVDLGAGLRAFAFETVAGYRLLSEIKIAVLLDQREKATDAQADSALSFPHFLQQSTACYILPRAQLSRIDQLLGAVVGSSNLG